MSHLTFYMIHPMALPVHLLIAGMFAYLIDRMFENER